MVKEGIVLGHKISKNEIEVDKAKVDVIAKLPHPTTVKGIRSFLGHGSFYRRFIQDFLKIAPSMTRLLEKDTPFMFSKECIESFQSLKKKLIKAPIFVAPDWDLPFELMCDASDFAIGEYFQWVERFMNYLEEQADGEAMINSIKNGDQPLPCFTQVSIAGISSTEQPPLKDKSMCNKTAKDLWDALARHMLGSEYGEQDRKAAVLYEYETFKVTKGELLLDTYIRYLQWKQYATMMRQIKNLMDINIDALYNILKQNQGDVNDAMGSKKKTAVVTSDSLALIAEKTNVSKSKEKVVVSSDLKGSDADDLRHFAKDCKKAKVRDYEYYKTKMLLAKKDKDEQVFLAEDQAWMESSSDSDQEINANMVFMAQIEKVLSDSEASSSFADERFLRNFHDAIESTSENFIENHIDSQKDYDKSDVDHNDSEEKDQLVDRKGIGFENPSYFENAKDLRPMLYDEKVIGLGKGIGFENPSYFKKAKDLRPTLYDEKINLKDDYFQEIINPDFEKIDSSFQQTSSLKPYVPNVILEKIIIDLEDEVVNLLEKEKVNLETIESLKSKTFELSENVSSESENQSENDFLVVENECDKDENSKVIAPGIFKLNVSQCVSQISMSKSSCNSNNVEIKLKRKRRIRKSSKQNVKQVDNNVSRANNDFVHFLDLDTFSSVRRPRHRDVIWKKKGSSNTSNVGLSAVRVSNLNKNIKRYSRKDLLAISIDLQTLSPQC
nr:reverse transcriptase domain-containing protein [Tanacetum cinerariifolium]